MKLGSLKRDPTTGKAGWVVKWNGTVATLRGADGEEFTMIPGATKQVRVNIYGEPGEYGGVLIDHARAAVITDGHPVWNGCKITRNCGSWVEA